MPFANLRLVPDMGLMPAGCSRRFALKKIAAFQTDYLVSSRACRLVSYDFAFSSMVAVLGILFVPVESYGYDKKAAFQKDCVVSYQAYRFASCVVILLRGLHCRHSRVGLGRLGRYLDGMVEQLDACCVLPGLAFSKKHQHPGWVWCVYCSLAFSRLEAACRFVFWYALDYFCPVWVIARFDDLLQSTGMLEDERTMCW
ncbi:hypothetical protein Nepgr_006748 [Nepenthes gracilis]|uniref:Uncharacterized protein n=1 Tax=Nepenthes gracilis TaxID=150966 RepID=A0AAD3S5L5_NEPGR|nr:hypothetical protein Nepgr_006748 [Nepenthes gracilis]